MSAEIINLRAWRKRKERVARETSAEENRLRFGRTKAERDRQALEQTRDKRSLDGAERTAPILLSGDKPDGSKSET